MSVTKFLLAEQVLFKYYGGYIDNNGPVQMPDVYKAIEQKINGLFKLHQFDATLPSGETIPEHAMLATYEDIAVTSVGQKSESILPIMPISLPKNMGIYLVYDNPDNPFIPLQRGQSALLKSDSLLNDLQGMISYEPKNSKVIYNKDITTLGITVVTMELCVLEISRYSITDPLPIPADMEGRIVDELVASFAPVQAESGIVNNFTNAGQTQPVK